MINVRKKTFDQSLKSYLRPYDSIWKTETDQEDDFDLLHYPYF